ncbi:GNAT family N-acetyltransferase [Sphingosinicella terrae]|uniref:GNAT family N-acetyltransferase n=1 Tax=Sphingosinicella terrae TaxID=2172047 RepID=UPI000E0D6A30|nr:GNAT family N-acetyltransferase [Sphingosinicella terrae]
MAIPAADSAGPSARLHDAAAGTIASALAQETTTVTVRDPAEALVGLEPEWAALADDAAEPNCFAESWFVAASLDALGADEGVRLLEVRRGGRLIGIFMSAIGADYGRTPVRHVANWWHHNMFLGIPLVRRGEEQGFWTALLDALDGAAWAPNFIHLRDISENGPVHRGLAAAAAARGRSCATVHREVRALLASDLEPQAYYERQVRPKKRKEIRRLRSRLGELGPVRARTLGDGDDLESWCDAFLALEQAGWKGEAGSALACDPRKEAFFRAAVAGARTRGRLHFLRLDLGEHPIAMLVNFLAPPGSFSFKTAFDEDYARFSPGVLVQLENLAVLDRADIGWMDSCAAENHPMIDSLWSGRRGIVRVTVRLSGPRRGLVHFICRSLEIASRAARRLAGKEQA